MSFLWSYQEPKDKKPDIFGECPTCHQKSNFTYVGMQLGEHDLYRCEHPPCETAITKRHILPIEETSKDKLENEVLIPA